MSHNGFPDKDIWWFCLTYFLFLNGVLHFCWFHDVMNNHTYTVKIVNACVSFTMLQFYTFCILLAYLVKLAHIKCPSATLLKCRSKCIMLGSEKCLKELTWIMSKGTLGACLCYAIPSYSPYLNCHTDSWSPWLRDERERVCKGTVVAHYELTDMAHCLPLSGLHKEVSAQKYWCISD